VAKLFLSSEQRFTCAQCGRCCHRTTVPITIEEAEALRAAGAAEWFDDGGVAKADPFEVVPGHAPLLRIRKRADGACGFLTRGGLCRIHEVLGADRKPLACRVFPFAFHPTGGEVVVSASFACPTVIANAGAPLTAQKKEIQTLQLAWARVFPEPERAVEFTRGRPISREALGRLRSFLVLILDRPDDLRANLRRIAALLEDWSRPRVLALEAEALIEYLDLTGNYALASDKPPSDRAPSRVARLLFRGFLYAIVSLEVRLDPAPRRLPLTATLGLLLAHVHGVGPPIAGVDLRRARRMPLRLDDPAVRAVVHRHLRAGFEILGAQAGISRPVVDEIAVRVSQLNAACIVGAMIAAKAGKTSVDAESLTQGLLAAGDLSHAEAGGPLSALLTMFAAGAEALYLFPPL